MDVRFLGQPFGHDHQIGVALAGMLQEHAAGRAWIVTAWAKQSGLGRIQQSLQDFKNGGGHITAVVGIDEGGATKEGLKLALDSFDRAFVYHDNGPRTFHPKMYLVRDRAECRASAIVGSGNLTKGGLFTNYEAAMLVALNLGQDEDRALWDSMFEYFQSITAESDLARPLTSTLLEELEADPGARLSSERSANASRLVRRALASDQPSLFGSPRKGLAGAPAPGVFAVTADEDDTDDFEPEAEHASDLSDRIAEAEAADPVADASAGEGFFKRLSAFDVSPHSAPGQIIIPIRFRSFFPELTVEKDETSSGGVRQLAAEFPVRFIQEGWVHPANARVILYEPAANHPRQNKELRFTFRSIAIRDSLSKEDVLVFRRTAASGITVEWQPQEYVDGSAKFGSITG